MQLEHANITVRSIEESARFLGIAFPRARIRGEGPQHGDASIGRWVHFGTDDFYIALQQNTEHSARRDATYRHDGINHVGFVVEDLDRVIEDMAAAGYKLTDAESLVAHPHRRRTYFIDGNGIEWEFVEYRRERSSDRNDYSI